MKKRILSIIAIICLAMTFTAAPVKADVGPKPSVRIRFENEPGEPYYVTLLSDQSTYGPWSAGGDGSSIKDPEINAFFNDYKDPDGFYYIGNAAQVTDGSYSWTYYPPKRFKILVYFPQSGDVFVSDIQERFAFDSYYTCDLKSGSVTENPDIQNNLIGFGVRLVLTILIEYLIALLFGFRSGKARKIILITNLLTQILLNAAMGILDYTSGLLVWLILFPLMELIVMLIESIIYAFALKEQKPVRRVVYGIVANLVSAVIGFFTGVFIG